MPTDPAPTTTPDAAPSAPATTDAPQTPVDDQAAAKASKAFLDAVAGSRSAIQKCHAAAVHSDPALAKPVALSITARFNPSGMSEKVLLTPFVSQDFEACMQAIATTWKLELTSAMTFKANITLTP
jgi:hypothetical protein